MFSLKVQKGDVWELVLDETQQLPEGRVYVMVVPHEHVVARSGFWSNLKSQVSQLFHTTIQGAHAGSEWLHDSRVVGFLPGVLQWVQLSEASLWLSPRHGHQDLEAKSHCY